jgi:hypothetical protein
MEGSGGGSSKEGLSEVSGKEGSGEASGKEGLIKVSGKEGSGEASGKEGPGIVIGKEGPGVASGKEGLGVANGKEGPGICGEETTGEGWRRWSAGFALVSDGSRVETTGEGWRISDRLRVGNKSALSENENCGSVNGSCA